MNPWVSWFVIHDLSACVSASVSCKVSDWYPNSLILARMFCFSTLKMDIFVKKSWYTLNRYHKSVSKTRYMVHVEACITRWILARFTRDTCGWYTHMKTLALVKLRVSHFGFAQIHVWYYSVIHTHDNPYNECIAHVDSTQIHERFLRKIHFSIHTDECTENIGFHRDTV